MKVLLSSLFVILVTVSCSQVEGPSAISVVVSATEDDEIEELENQDCQSVEIVKPKQSNETSQKEASGVFFDLKYGESSNSILKCPEDKLTDFFGNVAYKYGDFINIFEIKPKIKKIHRTFVDLVKNFAELGKTCDGASVNVVKINDIETAERVSNYRDPTDNVNSHNFYHVTDESVFNAIKKHGNLISGATIINCEPK